MSPGVGPNRRSGGAGLLRSGIQTPTYSAIARAMELWRPQITPGLVPRPMSA
jgi:hypothetical protein